MQLLIRRSSYIETVLSGYFSENRGILFLFVDKMHEYKMQGNVELKSNVGNSEGHKCVHSRRLQ